MDPMGTSIWSIIPSIPSWIPITRTSPFKQPDLHRHPSDCRTRPEGDVMRPPRGALLLAICVAIGAGQWASTLGAMAAGQWGNGARGMRRPTPKVSTCLLDHRDSHGCFFLCSNGSWHCRLSKTAKLCWKSSNEVDQDALPMQLDPLKPWPVLSLSLNLDLPWVCALIQNRSNHII